ncbi:MAG TPA: class II glutamine amidotransferase [Burkholderiales bacterium]|jgi:predicted glutamine amidotransferase|nr:class II glutamine amidotransferase [Burkholderiales bacterium]
MCRALLYLGQPVLLDNLLFRPDSALVRQSTMPRMLNMLNLAGFGLRAWDPQSNDPQRPFAYYSLALPVFDRNLQNLAHKIRSSCLLAHVRGVAYSTRVEIALQNVHPFHFGEVPFVLAHNGDLAGFERMKPLLSAHVKPAYLAQIHGTTDSEWIYAVFLSQLADPHSGLDESSAFGAIQRTLEILRDVRARLDIALASSVNLFITNGRQLVALRYCFDFGCYRTDDPSKMHEANLNFLSLWYTLGRDYAMHDGEWKMIGGAENADSIIVASEPLTRDTAAWVELPEYGALFAEVRGGRPRVTVRLLD